MPNFVIALGYNSTSSPSHETRKDVNLLYVADRTFDLSTTAVVASTYQNNYYTALSGVVSGDTIDVLPVPTNTLVLLAGRQTMRAPTANTNGTIAVSLVAPSTTLIAAATVSTALTTLSSVSFAIADPTASTAATGAIGFVVTSSGGTNIRVTVGTAVPDAKIRIFAVLADISQVVQRIN